MSVFTRNDAPYFLTLVVGLLGTSVSVLAERLRSTPTIEYWETVVRDTTRIHVRNISRSLRFEGLNITFETSRGGKFAFANYVDRAPASSRGELTVAADSTTAKLPVAELQPGWELVFRYLVNPPETKVVPRYETSSTARLVKRSFETRLVENEIRILIGLVGLWAIFVVGYVIALALPSKSTAPPQPQQRFLLDVSPGVTLSVHRTEEKAVNQQESSSASPVP